MLALAMIMNMGLLIAQPPETQYLLDLADVKLSGFGSANFEVSIINGDAATSSGGSGAVLFNYRFFAGAYNLSLNPDCSFPNIYPTHHSAENPLDPVYTNNKIRLNHGGLWVGYIHNPNNLWHLGANLRFGRGRIALYDRDINFREFDEHHRDWVGVVTPEIDIMINVTRWFKYSMSIGYRWVYGVDARTYTDAQGLEQPLYTVGRFSSPTVTARFLFGAFGPRTNGQSKH